MLENRLAKEESMLIAAGVLTWALVAWVGISQTALHTWQGMLNATLYGLYLVAFILIATDKVAHNNMRFRRLATLAMPLIVLSLLLTVNHALLPILFVIWASLLPEFFNRRQAISQLLLANLVYYALLQWHWHEQSNVFNILIYLGFQLFAYSSSQARLSERQSRLIQEQLNQQLIATRALLSQASEQQERLRISRDLHDILGHQLTALSLQLELLSHKAPEDLKPQVNQSKSLAKELLESIRAVVRAQRVQVGLDLVPPLEALMTRLPSVTLTCKTMKPLQSAELTQALLLVLQEGISNAVRHGKANQLHLSMEDSQNALVLQLRDNGMGLTRGTARNVSAKNGTELNGTELNGTGLDGMQERLQPFNGKVQLRANDSAPGCQLTLTLPALA
ncbi:MAG: two-component sensor histidine kinase [Gammaproteobacteria bacterium]|nr:two-component sensor histidine kinase [Gammaproteobacteria bacterium]MBU1478372.1 two-component sensor histidine kinase [Gammaproteobacteria bacterium]MBU2001910.1 two-component sensor histidine kinase [Gammaproteobacteria bacterium]MBU2131034.1 two-component sensor histidine kinase [Gammaproteobacteria bacterium]MBU2188796.1 two-component sensor histidine kinase [Gammaproteobacteria bacterium]